LVVARDWRQIHFRGASWLVLATLPGIPLGLWLLVGVAEPVVKAILAVAILAFSLYSLVRPGRATLGDDRWAGVFGFVAGVLGGAYGMNGPPLVMFGTLRGWTPERFRATLQGYFLPASAIVMASYALAGLWTSAVSRYYLLSLPGVIAAIFLGREINRSLSAERFARFVHLALVAIGALLLAQAVG
jgi:uncharacterized membrane protein YfcA